MWLKLQDRFEKLPSQAKVARLLLSMGLSVRKGQEEGYTIFCGNIPLTARQVAKAAGVDRRVVIQTMEKISSDPDLATFYSRLTPAPNLGISSSALGMGVLQIIPESARQPGIISGVLDIIARNGISVRQVISDDPELTEEPRAIIVTETQIPPELIPEMRRVKGVQGIAIM